MHYSKSQEIVNALDFQLEIDGTEYQIKPNVLAGAALSFGYVASSRGMEGAFSNYFGTNNISLHDDISAIPAIVASQIRETIRDQLTPRDCVVSLVWEEVSTIMSILREAGHDALETKVLWAYVDAGVRNG